jgi:hypothetical protein
MKKKAAKATKPKRSTPRRPTDTNQIAHLLVERSTVEPTESIEPTKEEISRVMAALGHRGGKVGGKKRAASLSPEKRSEIARKAARSRWDKPNS